MTRAEWDRAVALVRRAALGEVTIVDGAEYRSAYVCQVVHEADAPDAARAWLAVALETGARLEMGTVGASPGLPRSRVLSLSVYWDKPRSRVEDEPVGVDDEQEVDPGRGIPRVPGDRF